MAKSKDDGSAAAFDVPPIELKGDDVALAEWKRVVPSLRRRRRILRCDRSALIAYCSTYSNWIACQMRIRKWGPTVNTKSGYRMQAPEISIAAQEKAALMKFWSAFGLTPASRARQKLDAPKLKDTPKEDVIEDKEDEEFDELFVVRGGKR